jgi:hypothetical protein
MTADIMATVENMTTDEAEQLGRWWAMRENAIGIGRLAESELARANALAPHKRLFISRTEWEQLTQAG